MKTVSNNTQADTLVFDYVKFNIIMAQCFQWLHNSEQELFQPFELSDFLSYVLAFYEFATTEDSVEFESVDFQVFAGRKGLHVWFSHCFFSMLAGYGVIEQIGETGYYGVSEDYRQ